MIFEFKEDLYIVEALQMFGPMNPVEIEIKLKMREDIKPIVKKEICNRFYIQSRCEMMIRQSHIKESDIERLKNEDGKVLGDTTGFDSVRHEY